MSDMSCLAEGLVVPADFEQTGINLNEIVVGPTGCGKTTLVNLLMQLYVAGKGTIYINNKDYRTITILFIIVSCPDKS